jgi:hypothetical protein
MRLPLGAERPGQDEGWQPGDIVEYEDISMDCGDPVRHYHCGIITRRIGGVERRDDLPGVYVLWFDTGDMGGFWSRELKKIGEME